MQFKYADTVVKPHQSEFVYLKWLQVSTAVNQRDTFSNHRWDWNTKPVNHWGVNTFNIFAFKVIKNKRWET